MTVQGRKYTIGDIKDTYEREAKGNRLYFNKDTLAFFGQTLGSFHVKHVRGRVFIFAWSNDPSWSGKVSLAEFDPGNGEIYEITVVEHTKEWLSEFWKSVRGVGDEPAHVEIKNPPPYWRPDHRKGEASGARDGD